jgi:hypothetical protein
MSRAFSPLFVRKRNNNEVAYQGIRLGNFFITHGLAALKEEEDEDDNSNNIIHVTAYDYLNNSDNGPQHITFKIKRSMVIIPNLDRTITVKYNNKDLHDIRNELANFVAAFLIDDTIMDNSTTWSQRVYDAGPRSLSTAQIGDRLICVTLNPNTLQSEEYETHVLCRESFRGNTRYFVEKLPSTTRYGAPVFYNNSLLGIVAPGELDFITSTILGLDSLTTLNLSKLMDNERKMRSIEILSSKSPIWRSHRIDMIRKNLEQDFNHMMKGFSDFNDLQQPQDNNNNDDDDGVADMDIV